jgi:biotin transport system substrate-specific component
LNATRTMLSTKQLVHVGLFTALIVVFAIVPPIPLPVVPVPITLQTLGVMLAGLVLGPRLAALALALYVVLALVDLPVLPGGRSGLAVLAGPTGGFLLGFIPGAWAVGSIASHQNPNWSPAKRIALGFVASVVGGLLVVYAIGIPWLAMVTGMDIWKATLAVAVFVPGDLIKALVAAIVAVRLVQLRSS